MCRYCGVVCKYTKLHPPPDSELAARAAALPSLAAARAGLLLEPQDGLHLRGAPARQPQQRVLHHRQQPVLQVIIVILVIITIIPRKKQSKHTNYHAACLYHNRDDVSWGGSATHGIYGPLVFYRSHTWLKTLRPATSAIRNAIEHGRRSSRVFS